MTEPEPTPGPVLRRSKTDKVFGGVAGGLGRYLGVDPILLRVAFAVLALAAGTGVFLYVIGWIAIPEEKEGDPVGPASATGGLSARTVVGGLIVLAGAVLLLNQIVPDLGRFVWPALLIVVGVAVVLRGRR